LEKKGNVTIGEKAFLSLPGVEFEGRRSNARKRTHLAGGKKDVGPNPHLLKLRRPSHSSAQMSVFGGKRGGGTELDKGQSPEGWSKEYGRDTLKMGTKINHL